MSSAVLRDHGGGLDAAIARYGGGCTDWLDLSTGINPVPYPVAGLRPDDWTALPDRAASDMLISSAREVWRVPADAAVLAVPGASALIARIPSLIPPDQVQIPGPTYNEHRAAFETLGWKVADPASARVLVHPNNPDGRLWSADDALAGDPRLLIIDESFADVMPQRSLIALASRPGSLILKSFGKFWGLAGMRLGFAIGDPALIADLAEALGPWPVSGPALRVGSAALLDADWAVQTRARLQADAAQLDRLMTHAGATGLGGTDLFRLYEVNDANAWRDRLAQHHVWSRIFPYSRTWLRLGLPAPNRWGQLEAAL